ncbi:MAG: Asp-tRNA(Asn)/Glu-tRNA(Gln) amidotransferase subunit GatB [Planctomycetota bacterium]
MSSAVSTLVPVIGLEVHCQLATQTKLFCPCPNRFGSEPNTQVCPVCLGAPGALPVLGEEAVRLAVRAGLALGGTIDAQSRFDRKHYFYCDLPKGYQISQFARPIVSGGGLTLAGEKRVRLRRIHLEEDAGKAIHDRGSHTRVDLNRAGVPLIEIVSEPDLGSPAEAYEYLAALRETLVFAGVSECDMEKGSLRCDVNVSLHEPGAALGTRVELKNLNSFKNVAAALEHEIARQRALYASGERVRQETRQWDAERGESRPMRSKEDEHDYRYVLDPDLPPVVLSAAAIEAERARLPESAPARRARWQAELGLSAYDAGVLTGTRTLADFFEETARLSGAPKESANWLANDVAALLRAQGRELAATRLTPARLARLIELVQGGALGKNGARTALAELLEKDETPEAVVARLGLAQVGGGEELSGWCRAALGANARAAADFRAGEERALGALIGAVMKASRGRANPEVVRATLVELLKAEEPA